MPSKIMLLRRDISKNLIFKLCTVNLFSHLLLFLSQRQLLPPCLSVLCPEKLASQLLGWQLAVFDS